ncbi:class I SAM-dependent methyltransferase [Microbacterium sp. M3]|uniref:Class I SAM-dependent methyltransferase n=1 Tax=Microbacterium arthrosphaerae TaxID=792652 RepID=A0ABU4H483_9MICO|nr:MULTISPECIES: class I SAM-dependent methyltransferase [Microbacterium]MDW4574149.1 class I SAM-dependent methyltransferase [Microbacterium arthrosphaerae]MDW7608004.1 class I SAM-dependent methyltransferase [Microbacterium sp. M3]
MARGMHFDAGADDYDAARPPYPPALWGRLRALGLLEPGRAALDLGAGSGQATGPLLAAGLPVTAIEPGPRLAALLRRACPAATVIEARAEDAALGVGYFDLAVAATSVHWFDLDIVLPKLHAALTPDGRFAVWRNVFGDPDAPPTPFRARIAEIVAARRPPARPGPPAEDLTAMSEALTASGLFRVDDCSTYRWTVEFDADAVRRLFGTFSDWSRDEVRQAAAAVTDLGGSVAEHYSSWLLVLAPQRSSR